MHCDAVDIVVVVIGDCATVHLSKVKETKDLECEVVAEDSCEVILGKFTDHLKVETVIMCDPLGTDTLIAIEFTVIVTVG